MVIKIDKEGNAQSDSFDPPPSKKHKSEEDTPSRQEESAVGEKKAGAPLVCAGCKVSDKEASGPLLLFDDPEEDEKDTKAGDETR